MTDEQLRQDGSSRHVAGAVTNDENKEIRNLRVNPSNNGLLIDSSQETICTKVVVADTDMTPIAVEGDPDIQAVEIKNRSGIDIYVNPNSSDEFPLADGEDRLVYTKKLSHISLARQLGTGNATIHLIYEI